MKARRAIILAAAALLVAPVARSGHELPVYPSYYPARDRDRALAPQRASDLMRAGKLHAYVGGAAGVRRRARQTPSAPWSRWAPSSSSGSTRIRRSPGMRRRPAPRREPSCATWRREPVAGGFIVHPYPVTPFHGDYLHHADLARGCASRDIAGGADASPSGGHGLKVRAEGALAQKPRPARVAAPKARTGTPPSQRSTPATSSPPPPWP